MKRLLLSAIVLAIVSITGCETSGQRAAREAEEHEDLRDVVWEEQYGDDEF